MRKCLSCAVLVAATLSAACEASSAREVDAVAPGRTTHYVVILDRSTSVSEAQVQNYRSLVSTLIERLTFGDRYTMFVAYGNDADGRRNGTSKMAREMPPAINPQYPSATERDALMSARSSLAKAAYPLFDVKTTPWTDLMSSFRTASDNFALTANHKPVLIVLSDMLHCVPSATCLESGSVGSRKAPEPDAVTADLQDVCVAIVGADLATQRDVRIRDYWKRYFEIARAAFADERYRYSTMAIPPPGC
jgi:hypothetical protein